MKWATEALYRVLGQDEVTASLKTPDRGFQSDGIWIRQATEISHEKPALVAELVRDYMGRVEWGDNNVAMLTPSRIATAPEITMSQLLAEAGV
jgi:hypothetical protein